MDNLRRIAAISLSLSLAGLAAFAVTPKNDPAAKEAAVKTSATPKGSIARPGHPAPEFTLADAEGKNHDIATYRGKYVVLEWVNYDCPFVKKHYNSGNMQKLQKEYRAKGVVWLSVNSSAQGKQGYFAGAELKKRMADAKAGPDAYLIDTDGTVGRLYKAKSTPHMFVIDPEGMVIYAGAIDDHPSTDLADVPKAKNYVQAALDAALAGNPVETASTAAYGCSVKYAE